MAEEPWEAFGVSNAPSMDDVGIGSLAADVCSVFGISCVTADIGGPLKNVDIKFMDALSVIRLSLFDEAAENGTLYEPMVNEDGDVEFKEIGIGTSSISDVYYTIQTQSYKEDCSGVMITGGKPLPERHVAAWTSIIDNGKKIYSTNTMMSNCNKLTFDRYATIVYNDPHFDTAFEDGIENLYEIGLGNPYDKVIGYAYKIIPPENSPDSLSISFDNTSDVPICIAEGDNPDVGELIRPPTTPGDLSCWVGLGTEAPTTGGIEIQIPDELRYKSVRDTDVDKFLGVSQVYIVGTELDLCVGIPINDAVTLEEPSENNTGLYISVSKNSSITFKLDEGVHYVVGYNGSGVDKKARVIFANNSRIYDKAKFGTEVDYKVLPGCLWFDEGVLEGTDTIIPTGGIKGILVKEVWAVISLDTPCINIFNPEDDALGIAEGMVVECAPLVVTEAPAPVAKDGSLIDLTDGIVDHDPTTTQDLTETALEKAISDMAAGPGLSTTLSFLDESGVKELSSTLKSYMSSGDGVETTYVCGPNCEPKLGENGNAGGIINNITYSYTDGGSYTISVNEGPKIVGGMEGFSGGFNVKQTEEMSAQGTILQDAGNHIDYKVRIDGFGDRYAINCCPKILRVGDRVQVSVHNNPVES